MKKRFTEEQIIGVLKETEAGMILPARCWAPELVSSWRA